MSKVLILMGLPGSGKTFFAETYRETCGFYCSKQDVNHIHIDQMVNSRFSACKDAADAIQKGYKRTARINILDGLFLTNQDVIKAIRSLPEKAESVEIHYWSPDKEACLYNDCGRRNKPAKAAIQGAEMELLDKDMIKEQADIETLNVIYHKVEKKPLWKKKVEELMVNVQDGRYIYSETWSLGGEYGNCWDSSMTPVDGDPEPAEFTELDQILEAVCPELTIRQYKDIYREYVGIKEKYESDYYGGGITYAYYCCNLEKLFNFLEKEGILRDNTAEDGWITEREPLIAGYYWITTGSQENAKSMADYWDGTKWRFGKDVRAWMEVNAPSPYIGA